MLVAVFARIVAVLLLFGALFVSIFWTPGVLLALFALAYAADSRALSQVLERRRRRDLVLASLRRYRGGWLDSPTTAG